MSDTDVVWLIMFVMGLIGGIGLSLVKASAVETDKVSKLFPGAALFRYKVVRVTGALACFGIAALSMLNLSGVLP